jgi:hypothetical protein
MSLSEKPARLNNDAIGSPRMRRKAMACCAANPVALGKTIRFVSPVTFNAPSVRAAPIERPIWSHGKSRPWSGRHQQERAA